MAEAGFYWCGNERENDTASCFICGKVLDGWEETDDPWAEHQKHAPQCAFVKLGRPENDITLAEYLDLIEVYLKNIITKTRLQTRNEILKRAEIKREAYEH